MQDLTSVRWAMRGWWRRSGARQLALLGVVLSFAAVLWTGHPLREPMRREPQSFQLLDDVRAKEKAATESPLQAAPPQNFTARLPAVVDSAAALFVVQSAAQRAGVVMTSVQSQDTSPTSERLGRSELSVALRGEYAAVKQWLAEVAARLRSATVSRMQVHRAEGAPGVEARVVINVWSQAVASAPPALR